MNQKENRWFEPEPPQKQEYKLLYGSKPDLLNNQVNEYLANGWTLYGNPIGPHSLNASFYQAVVRQIEN